MHSYVATPGCPPALETKGIPEFNRPANQPKVVATPDGPLNTGLNSSSIQRSSRIRAWPFSLFLMLNVANRARCRALA